MSVISHFHRCQFCLSPSISLLHVMNTELLVDGCHSDGDTHKCLFKGCFLNCMLPIVLKIMVMSMLSV